MKAIKKVEVTPLDYNIGKIIDSAATSDDKTKNTYSMRVIDSKVSDINSDISDINREVDGLSTYSLTTEKVVGTWIDGKPIYRKVINLGDLTDTSRWTEDGILIGFSINNLDKIVKFDTYGYSSWGTVSLNNYMFYDNNLGQESSMYTIISVVDQYMQYIIIKNTLAFDTAVTTGVAILEYTKTTD